MRLEDVLNVARSSPDEPPGYQRYVVTREGVRTANDLLADDTIEIVTISREIDPEDAAGRSQLMGMDNLVEVLQAWSEWRGGTPTTNQAAAAIMWYVDHDAFIPADRT